MNNYSQILAEETACAETAIRRYLPEETGYQKTVLTAMKYSVEAGGKRLRPLFIHVFYELFGGQGDLCEPFMAAIEYIHTYSLIHDDLPAMDNDDLRRGKPTCHKKFGEDMAILAGDGLLNYAYETAISAFETHPDAIGRIASALSLLSRKAGIYGMVGGQTVDVENDGKPLSSEQLEMIYENKTAALLEASMMIGAILAGASEQTAADIERIASSIGVAFQIQDDILDVAGNEEELGKPIGSDNKNSKITYVSIYGMNDSTKKVESLTAYAKQLLKNLPDADPRWICFIGQLFDQLVHRTK